MTPTPAVNLRDFRMLLLFYDNIVEHGDFVIKSKAVPSLFFGLVLALPDVIRLSFWKVSALVHSP